ncbi:conserved hypothetical protein [Frankia canadensis]|uniref:DUF4439 domain-containing protein n=1 Tax=Frankia canadensis TaxID=1836972 RepID=A0A2I2L250_9ACTN|nr:DUF4439 domain-containing protein [Frankia canadensis]SNQ51992.1 conserved hypothetical protein [Frankia canadensis]SOU59282.1 conserved hypothetical protein [Frankia canadensis]
MSGDASRTARVLAAAEADGQPAPRLDQEAAVGALGAMLEACHAAIYATATAGGALAPLGPPAAAARELARSAWLAHRELRDALVSALQAEGARPPAALPAYRLPAAPVSVAAALRVLAQVEDACAAAAHDATAVLSARSRRLAVDALGGAAIRAQRARLSAGLPPATATRALPGAV